MLRIVRSEGDGEKMIAHAGRSRDPLSTAVRRCKYNTTRSSHNNAQAVSHENPVEGRDSRTLLLLPFKATVAGGQHNSVRSYRPAMSLIAGELDGVN